jgi:hypothetical protein
MEELSEIAERVQSLCDVYDSQLRVADDLEQDAVAAMNLGADLPDVLARLDGLLAGLAEKLECQAMACRT